MQKSSRPLSWNLRSISSITSGVFKRKLDNTPSMSQHIQGSRCYSNPGWSFSSLQSSRAKTRTTTTCVFSDSGVPPVLVKEQKKKKSYSNCFRLLNVSDRASSYTTLNTDPTPIGKVAMLQTFDNYPHFIWGLSIMECCCDYCRCQCQCQYQYIKVDIKSMSVP
ncbi:hypothetical protein BC939DRAFT_197449 [Gamsiella multidivaricata]|uniref:uncharacterized protein n=1 Tax=Gamsiella multidivaricata TaxID=101098 RepID=UPI00221F9B94|nr:uncharacterized protein BC939DRAFT_197449 [Gamsiella multidivaricata]KAI7822062.1 hypothetical protein BC939DRAFT_197449 [Gamsiella multidivaricata]